MNPWPRMQTRARIIAGSVLWGVLGHAVAGQTPPETLRLADAVQQAIARAATSLDARDALSAAQEAQSLSAARFRPKFASDMFGSFGQSDLSNQTYGLGASQLFPTGTQVRANLLASSSRNQLGAFFGSDVAFTITQPLLRGFGGEALRRDLAIAQMRTASAERRRSVIEQQLALEVAELYYRIGAQMQYEEVARAALARARQLQQAAQAKVAAGDVSRLDVLRAAQLASQAEIDVLDAGAAVQEAKDQLRLLLQRGAAFDFSVEPIPSIAIAPLGLDEALALARSHRAELTDAQAFVRESELSLESAADQALPQLDVSWRVARNGVGTTLGSAFGADGFRSAVFAGVSVPFDQAPAASARAAAALRVEKSRRDLSAIELQVEQDVRTAHRNLQRLVLVLTLADAALALAREEAELARFRYDRGLSSNLDVVAAENTVLSTQARQLSVLAELALARLRLKTASGVLDVQTDFR